MFMGVAEGVEAPYTSTTSHAEGPCVLSFHCLDHF